MLTILYQDDHLIAVNKPAGQLVHPADEPQEGDLVTMKILRDQIGQEVHVIHRLDRPTCGVLLFSTDRHAATLVQRSFENREIEKVYHAVVIGHPPQKAWTCHEPLQKNENAPLKTAVTDFQVLHTLRENIALVEARPKTGRFHQIRRHLRHADHPIVGDFRYAGIQRSHELGQRLGTGTRMLLQAKSLTFEHPLDQRQITIEAPEEPLIQSLCES